MTGAGRRPHRPVLVRTGWVPLALALAACGPDASRGRPPDSAAARIPAPPAAVPPADAPLEPGDVQRFREGLEIEIAALESALTHLAAARTAADSAAVARSASPGRTRALAARRLELPEARYRVVSDRLEQALAARAVARTPAARPGSVATDSALTAEQRAQLGEDLGQMQSAWGDPLAALDPAVAERVARSAGALDSLRGRLLELRVRLRGEPEP